MFTCVFTYERHIHQKHQKEPNLFISLEICLLKVQVSQGLGPFFQIELLNNRTYDCLMLSCPQISGLDKHKYVKLQDAKTTRTTINIYFIIKHTNSISQVSTTTYDTQTTRTTLNTYQTITYTISIYVLLVNTNNITHNQYVKQ